MYISTESGSVLDFMYNDRSSRPQVFKERANYLEEIDEIEFKRINFAAVTKKKPPASNESSQSL
jgi:hypothetical protein